jgi:hypothetical protein
MKWVLLAGPSWLLTSGHAQTPPPALEHGEKAGMLLTAGSAVGDPVPAGQVVLMERLLEIQARKDALGIAATYARTGDQRLRGVKELGRQLMEELGKPGPGFDFQGVVSHNPVFWEAERGLAPADVSMPYLVSMLAILSRDYVTAARTIALAQATLPLTPTVRRGYARPEAMMLYLDQLLLTGVPSSTRMQTPEQCETSIALLRQRIAKWSNRPGLLRALIELEVRRVELLTYDGENLEMLDQRISERLGLTPADLAFARKNDPILASGFDATVRQWLSKATLAQQWSRWIEKGDPAGLETVEASVTVYAANDRPDLAWLTWRCDMVLKGIANPEEQRRWHAWCEKLLDAKSTAYVEATTAANSLAGKASMPIENEGFSEAWSGDQRVHPLLAVKIERRIAMVDTMLSVMAPGSSGEGNYRMKRAELLAEIDAIEPARRELRRLRQIIGDSETIMAAPGVKVMEFIKVTESRLLDSEDHYAAAEKMYRELLRNPRLSGLKINYQAHLFIAGNVTDAHEQFRAYALENPTDTYRSIMADLTARRLGQRETAILETARRNVLAESWPADDVKFLLGELSEGDLLESARHGTAFEIVDHECEAYFWLGEVALAEGRKEDSIKWLSRCIVTGYLSNVEFKIAKAELERLAPESKEKQKKSGPENSNGVITT